MKKLWVKIMSFILLLSLLPAFPAPVMAETGAGQLTVRMERTDVNEYWVEYSFYVNNPTSAEVSGVEILLPADPVTGENQPMNLGFNSCSYDSEKGGVLMFSSAAIPAGSEQRIGDKIGFNPVNVGTPRIIAYNVASGSGKDEPEYALTGEKRDVAFEDTPVGGHGALHLAEVSGYGNAPVIVDKNGKPFQMRGASSHGIQWDAGYNYVNKGAYQSLRDEWGVNMVRLAAYVTQGGYTEGAQSSMDATIEKGVQAATELGMYVIVDWHIHAEDPNSTKSAAEGFFRKYAAKYKGYDNVIFEICNEPCGVEWYNGSGSDLYSYCKDIVDIIRNECNNDSLIVCGTNTWSQDVDDVAKKPLKDDGFEDILYTLHFYSGSHYSNIQDKMKKAVNDGTPVFVTEFGICDASGNGGYDEANADSWIALCDKYNVSYACWSCCNKDESASYLVPSCTKTEGGWTSSDLSTTGIWLVNTYRKHQDAENGTGADENNSEAGDDNGNEGNNESVKSNGNENNSENNNGSIGNGTESDGNSSEGASSHIPEKPAVEPEVNPAVSAPSVSYKAGDKQRAETGALS